MSQPFTITSFNPNNQQAALAWDNSSPKQTKETSYAGLFSYSSEPPKEAKPQLAKWKKYGLICLGSLTGIASLLGGLTYSLRKSHTGHRIITDAKLWEFKGNDGKTYDLRRRAFDTNKNFIKLLVIPFLMFQHEGAKDIKLIEAYEQNRFSKPYTKQEYEEALDRLNELRKEINSLDLDLAFLWLNRKPQYKKHTDSFDGWIKWLVDNQLQKSNILYPTQKFKKSLGIKYEQNLFTGIKSIEHTDIPLDFTIKNLVMSLFHAEIHMDSQERELMNEQTKKKLLRRLDLVNRFREYGLIIEPIVNLWVSAKSEFKKLLAPNPEEEQRHVNIKRNNLLAGINFAAGDEVARELKQRGLANDSPEYKTEYLKLFKEIHARMLQESGL